MGVQFAGNVLAKLAVETRRALDLSTAADKMDFAYSYQLVDRPLEGNSILADTITVNNGFDLTIDLSNTGMVNIAGEPITFGDVYVIAVHNRIGAARLNLDGSAWGAIFGGGGAPAVGLEAGGVFLKVLKEPRNVVGSPNLRFVNAGGVPITFDLVIIGTFDNS